MQQCFAFSQIVTQLATACPSTLSNIVVQDPLITSEWKALLENHECRVVEALETFSLFGSNTFLFSAWVELEPLLDGLKDENVSDLAPTWETIDRTTHG